MIKILALVTLTTACFYAGHQAAIDAPALGLDYWLCVSAVILSSITLLS